MTDAVVIAILFITIALVVTWLLKKKRHDVWQQWAHQKNLTYRDPPTGPIISGRIDNRPITIETHNHGSDTEGPVEIVRISVGLQNLPVRLDAEGNSDVIGNLARNDENRLETGDETFDRDVIVRRTEPQSILLEYWNTDRRNAFLKLVREAPCDQILIEGDNLIGEKRTVISRLQHLEELTDALLTSARSLDGEKDFQ